MTGMSDPLSGGFIGKSQVDDAPIRKITPDEAHAAAVTLCDQAVQLGDGADEARGVLAAAGLL